MSEAKFEKAADNVFRINGALTIETAPGLMRQATEVLRGVANGATVEMNLSGVDACDSAAVAVLLEWRREAGRRNWELKFSGLPERLLSIARISDVDDLILT